MICKTMLICLASLMLASCILTTQEEDAIVAVAEDEAVSIASERSKPTPSLQKTDKYYYQFNTLESV